MDGLEHTFDIPNSYYDPQGTRLLSPQHWTKAVKEGTQYKYQDSSVYYQGNESTMSLHWGKHSIAVKLVSNNVANLMVRNQAKRCTSTQEPSNAVIPNHQKLWCLQVTHTNKNYKNLDKTLQGK